MAKLDELLILMKKEQASDLHLTSGSPPYLRIHGDMVKLNHRDLTAEETQALIFEILTEKQKRGFVENWELDCSYHIESVGRYRCNVFMQRRGIAAVFRIIPETIKTIAELGMPSSLLDLIAVHKGMVLVTGPTGSGKSTTLAALIHHINLNEKAHIVTVEDPIEFVHQNQKSLVNQREVSSHTKSFANALKAALREDPDIILVGEMRDLETISLAMTAAETGHLVFGTLHTNSAPKTVDRIIDVFPEAQQAQIRVMLSESLRGVVAQALLPKADRQGRVAVLEVLLNTPAVSNLIREGKTFQIPSSMQTGKAQGMCTFETSVMDLVKAGIVNKNDAFAFLGKKDPAAPTGIAEIIPGVATQNTTTGTNIPKVPPNTTAKPAPAMQPPVMPGIKKTGS